MSAIIKSRGAPEGLVRAISSELPRWTRAPAPDPEREPDALDLARLEIARLEAALRAAGEEVGALRTEAQEAFAAGERAGREAGRLETERESADAEAALRKGIAQAVARFEHELRAMERLAALLAEVCLERLFGTAADLRELATRLIAHQLEHLQDCAVLQIEVSKADFPRDAELAELAAAIERPKRDIRASGALRPGDCRMKLELGSLEVGLAQQWGSLRAALQEISDSGEAA